MYNLELRVHLLGLLHDVTPSALTSGTGDTTITTGTESIYSTTLTGLTPEYTPWHNTVTEAYQQNPDANFIVNMGDLTEIGQNYQHWNNWFSAANGVINNIPEMPVQGNHETYQTNTFESGNPQDFKNQFSVPQNGPTGHVGQTYSYDYGNAHFVVLDSQEDEEAPGKDSFLQEQADWLDKDLTKNAQKWTFVMFHKTPYYNKQTRNNPALIAKYYKETYDSSSLTLTINNKSYTFAKTDILNSDNSKVNIDALYKQGIDVYYNKELNCVLVDFTGRITSDMIAAFKGIKL